MAPARTISGRTPGGGATTAAATAAVLLATMLLAGCTGGDEREATAAAYAQRLAAGLQQGDLSSVPVGAAAGLDPTEALTASLGDLAARTGPDDGAATVRAGDVRVLDDAAGGAVVPLRWTWTLSGREWSYRSRLELAPGEPTADGAATWTTTWSPTWVHPSLGEGDALDVTMLDADRGDILGADDRPVVVERDVVRLGVDKTRLDGADPARSARQVARIVDVQVRPYVERVVAAGDRAFVPALTLRADDARARQRRVERVPGGLAFAETEPLAPTPAFAAPLLGRVGPVTAEVLAGSGGELAAGDQVGLSGLQARYDDRLRGTDGLVVRRVDASGEVVESLFDVPATTGEDLRLTLDPDLQARAESILADVPGSSGATALVALRPSDGAVLAAASGQGASGLATATFAAEPPGSTFKIVTALALLRDGLTPASRLACGTEAVVDGRRFTNYDGYPAAALGRITLRTALAQSCNTAFIGAADRLDPSRVAEAAAALGFGVDHDMGYPVSFGSIPDPTSETGAAAALIGQGRVTASPVVMAGVAASVQAGRAVLPRLVEGVDVEQAPPAAPLTPAESRQLRSLLRSVVTDGSGQVLADEGATGAKTGTAQFGDPGPGGVLPTHAWMVATRGDLAVAAYVERGDGGSRTAGPLLEQLLR